MKINDLGKRPYKRYSAILKWLARNKDHQYGIYKEIFTNLKCANDCMEINNKKYAIRNINVAYLLIKKYEKLLEYSSVNKIRVMK